jgi:hypothetical protein
MITCEESFINVFFPPPVSAWDELDLSSKNAPDKEFEVKINSLLKSAFYCSGMFFIVVPDSNRYNYVNNFGELR